MQSNDPPPEEISVSVDQLAKEFLEKRTLFVIEGGSVSTGRFRGRPALLTDESALSDYLDDAGEGGATLVRCSVFADEGHRQRYIDARGWPELRREWRSWQLQGLLDQIVKAEGDGLLDPQELGELLALLGELDGESRPSTGLEQRLEFRRWSPWAGSTEVVLRGENVFCTQSRGTFDIVQDADACHHRLSPSPRKWEAFWRALDRLDAWDWSDDDAPLHQIIDGEEWSIYLAVRGRVLHLSGYTGADDLNSYRLEKLVSPLKRLLHSWPQ